MTDILQAARSYYGLADIASCTTQLFTNQAGQACVAFEIPLSSEDFIAIGERMKAMQEAESQKTEQSPLDFEIPAAIYQAEWQAMSSKEKSEYGYSLARFKNEWMPTKHQIEDLGEDVRKVDHIDAPETEEPTTMDAVWISEDEVTEAQKRLPVDYNALTHDYLIQWSMLTEEQRQKAKERDK